MIMNDIINQPSKESSLVPQQLSYSSYFDNKSHLLFIALGSFFIANAVIAEFVGVKVFSLERSLGSEPLNFQFLGMNFSLNLTAGALLWPLIFVITDIINEYFGRRGVKILSYIAITLIGYGFLIVYFTMGLEPAEFWIMRNTDQGVINMEVAFDAVFGQGLWITIGSLFAFLVGQFIDMGLFYQVKRITGERYLWLRSTGSTMISQLFDSFIVLFISFHVNPATNWDLTVIIAMGTVKYSYKLIVAVALTPLIYLLHIAIDNYLGEPLANQLKRQAMQQNT